MIKSKKIFLLYFLLYFIIFILNVNAKENNEDNFIFDDYSFLSLVGIDSLGSSYPSNSDNSNLILQKVDFVSNLTAGIYLSELIKKDNNLNRVLIIKSKDNDVVNLFIKGFLSGYDINKVSIVDVKQVRNYDIDHFKIVVALTSEAANFLKDNYNPNALNIYSLVLTPPSLGVENKFIGFAVYPDINQVLLELRKNYPTIKNIGIVYSLETYNLNKNYSYQKIGINLIPINVNNYNIDKIENRFKECDAIFIIPDVFTLEEENLFKIIYKAKKNNKLLLSTHKVLLNYGVDLVFSVDYEALGKQVSNFIKGYSFDKKDKKMEKYLIFSDKFIVFTKGY